MKRQLVGHASLWAIGLVLRAWGRCLISTDRARSMNTAIMEWAIRALTEELTPAARRGRAEGGRL